MADLSAEEMAALRTEGYDDETTEEVAELTPESEPELEQELDAGESTVKPDPYEGLPDAVVEQLKGVESMQSEFEKMSFRLKQAEQRVGGLTNKLQAEEEAKAKVKEAPSDEELKAAADDAEAMESLREDWPEWAEALEKSEKRITKNIADKFGNVDVEKVRGELQTDFDSKLTQQQQNFEKRLVEFNHKGWEETVRSEEFNTWAGKQDDKTREQIGSNKAEDVVDILNMFKGVESGGSVLSSRKKRQENAQTVESSGHGKQNKATLTPAQKRAQLLRQGYDED